MPGVVSTSVGYINGQVKDPSYRAVCTGTTGHAEAVDVSFDPTVVSYSEILEVFWDQHDPTTLNRQGNDSGTQYRSGIYCYSEEQKAAAERSKAAEATRLGKAVVTEVVGPPAPHYYKAEEYHQQCVTRSWINGARRRSACAYTRARCMRAGLQRCGPGVDLARPGEASPQSRPPARLLQVSRQRRPVRGQGRRHRHPLLRLRPAATITIHHLPWPMMASLIHRGLGCTGPVRQLRGARRHHSRPGCGV